MASTWYGRKLYLGFMFCTTSCGSNAIDRSDSLFANVMAWCNVFKKI